MKNGKPEHFWRIHNRVARRLLGDLNSRVQEIIASDPASEQAQWFANKVNVDATRLFEDPNYYDNAESTFRTPAREAESLVVRRKAKELQAKYAH